MLYTYVFLIIVAPLLELKAEILALDINPESIEYVQFMIDKVWNRVVQPYLNCENIKVRHWMNNM